MNNVTRCPRPRKYSQMITYHDREWGVSLHEDQRLFEFLVPDDFQADLSWSTEFRKGKLSLLLLTDWILKRLPVDSWISGNKRDLSAVTYGCLQKEKSSTIIDWRNPIYL